MLGLLLTMPLIIKPYCLELIEIKKVHSSFESKV